MLLDHGLIVEIPDTLRQQYCQLWCSFILNDQLAAKAIATTIAGETSVQCLTAAPSDARHPDVRRIRELPTKYQAHAGHTQHLVADKGIGPDISHLLVQGRGEES